MSKLYENSESIFKNIIDLLSKAVKNRRHPYHTPVFSNTTTKNLVESGITFLSLEVIPRRLSKGQSMDVNSSQDNLSGYCAALNAASNLPKLMPMMTTAAGTIRPAKFVIQGAAVGGGLGLALAADFRIACEESRFSANFAKLGFHQGFGTTITLPRVEANQKAKLM